MSNAFYCLRMKTEKAHQEKRGDPNRGEGGEGISLTRLISILQKVSCLENVIYPFSLSFFLFIIIFNMIKNWITCCVPYIEYILKFFTESGSLDWITTGSHCFRGKVLIVILHNWLGGGGSSDDVTEEDFDEMILATFFILLKFISYQYPILWLLSFDFAWFSFLFFSFRQSLSVEAICAFCKSYFKYSFGLNVDICSTLYS